MILSARREVHLFDLGTGTNRNLLPLAIGLVASYAKAQPHLRSRYDIHVHFLRTTNEAAIQSMNDPAVVGISCSVWNARASLSLAAAVKRAFPDTLVVLGGYQVPKIALRMREFLIANPGIDVLCHAEGELTFAALLEAYPDRDAMEKVEGLTLRMNPRGDEFHTTPRRPRITDLDMLPSPFLDGTFDELMRRHGPAVTGAVWETNRGCPYRCTFCDWGQSEYSKIKTFSLDRLTDELRWMSRNEIFYLFGADANFGIYKERDYTIASKLADICEETGFPAYLMINWAKNSHQQVIRIADRLRNAGVTTTVTLSAQSHHEPTLKAIRRRNMRHDDLVALKKLLHDRALPTYTELILGLPLETRESFREGLGKSMTRRLDDHFVIYLCGLLENTEMNAPEYRERYGLQSTMSLLGFTRRKQEHEPEAEETVTATSTMPRPEWKASYVYGYSATVLYNHRAAFFVMIFLQEHFGVRPIDFISFCLDLAAQEPERWPRVSELLTHIGGMADGILGGGTSVSSIPGADDIALTPHEGGAALLCRNVAGWVAELGSLTRRFLEAHELEVDPKLLTDLLDYQRLVLPTWEGVTPATHAFATNLPIHMEGIVSGEPPVAIREEPTEVSAVTPPRPSSYSEFATTLLRSGYVMARNKITPTRRACAHPARVARSARATDHAATPPSPPL